MDVKVKQTNTTEASATLTHDELVGILGLAVMMQSGIERGQPGTEVDVALAPDSAGGFSATVNVVVDHNVQAPAADAPVPAPAAVPVTPADAPAAAAAVVVPPAISGLAIPTA